MRKLTSETMGKMFLTIQAYAESSIDFSVISCLNLMSQKLKMKISNNLDIAKSCQIGDIPIKVTKMHKHIIANFITNHFNFCFTYEYPDELKHANVIPVHRKNEKCDKVN